MAVTIKPPPTLMIRRMAHTSRAVQYMSELMVLLGIIVDKELPVCLYFRGVIMKYLKLFGQVLTQIAHHRAEEILDGFDVVFKRDEDQPTNHGGAHCPEANVLFL